LAGNRCFEVQLKRFFQPYGQWELRASYKAEVIAGIIIVVNVWEIITSMLSLLCMVCQQTLEVLKTYAFC